MGIDDSWEGICERCRDFGPVWQVVCGWHLCSQCADDHTRVCPRARGAHAWVCNLLPDVGHLAER